MELLLHILLTPSPPHPKYLTPLLYFIFCIRSSHSHHHTEWREMHRIRSLQGEWVIKVVSPEAETSFLKSHFFTL